ncbi:Planctomycete cytochrome C [Pirellulimonas nuda]|uniref:Planctomycete cytochrome C n=1 Tax=Pirellulimonas nuda TaxID=2528009 RepID=A0A518D665_9BACT|nr:PSD1 and planctomycete cytochrome C domain-containing protein [Pirellulimonas nuda]QDU86965.1 Planctomycete cytochrome C [Pirellulimonas nuda]
MRVLLPLIAIYALAAPAAAQHAAQAPSFARDVQPILAARCYACHGPDQQQSGLALHSRAGALAEADTGTPAVTPGDAAGSELVRRIASSEAWERMPPEGEPLTATQIETLRAWIDAGAGYEPHWAFVERGDPRPPETTDQRWARNGIDRFVLARLEAAGLRPAAEADNRTLARRLYYDLTGLPPTPQQLEAFLHDDRPDAYERLVDKLLDSPHYGERWARHWLDLVRYAETNSFERDGAKPGAWKYRDYVIRSLNDDKPYDRFIREQLAGDELDEVTPETMTATGYYRLGAWDDEPADPEQSLADELDNIVSTTSQAVLGLTVGCARCHDHKIDPVPQTDYYGLVAFMADVTTYGVRSDQTTNNQWAASGERVNRQHAQAQRRLAQLERRVHDLEQRGIAEMPAADQRRSETHERPEVLKKLKDFLPKGDWQRYEGLVAERDAVVRERAGLPKQEFVLALAKCDPRPDVTHVMLRGNAHALGDPVEPCFPELFGDDPPRLPTAAEGARTAGRRRVLADWITAPENRLTPRVIANRVWQHHFGRGIVRSSNNFGQLGTPPTHPELLDWLANWLVDNDWRLKPLHRLMVTSSSYRMSSQADDAALAADPQNDLFWRFDMRRLSAEEIRDTVLQVSGQLDGALYGPSIYPRLSREVLATQSQPGNGWPTTPDAQAARRSIYIHVKRSLIPPELAAFDFPETDTSCEARFVTTQPAQALNLLHSGFVQRQAGLFAQRVKKKARGEGRELVVYALELALGRPADEETIADGLELIETSQSRHGLSPDAAFEQFCLLVLNLNEFVYLD